MASDGTGRGEAGRQIVLGSVDRHGIPNKCVQERCSRMWLPLVLLRKSVSSEPR